MRGQEPSPINLEAKLADLTSYRTAADVLRSGSQDVVLECAGNSRSFHQPRASGIQWANGAVGNAEWRGVRLADVLALARPRAAGEHVAFDGADRPPTPQARDFHPEHPDVEGHERPHDVAVEMNGHPVPDLHGSRARGRAGVRLGVAQVARADHGASRRSLGRVQPTSRAWNRLGYRWNVIPAGDKAVLMACLLRHFRDPAGR